MAARGSGIVYLLRHGNTRTYKIGRTVGSALKRRKTLTTGNPEQLHLVAQWEVPEKHTEFEKMLHLNFAHHRLRAADSTEFFDFEAVDEPSLTARIDAMFASFCARIEVLRDCDSEQTEQSCIDADECTKALIAEHRRLTNQIKLLQMECSEVDAKLKKKISGHAGIKHDGRERPIVSWTTIKSERFDSHKFKEAHPEIYKAFTNTISFRTFRVLD